MQENLLEITKDKLDTRLVCVSWKAWNGQ